MDLSHVPVGSDDAPLSCLRAGKGPPVMLVHGTSTDCRRWSALIPELSDRYSIYAMNRRGYGESPEGSRNYSLERERDDIVAMAENIADASLGLVAHSFGALCALEALTGPLPVGKLVLYEPPVKRNALGYYAAGSVERISALARAGDGEAVLSAFCLDVLHLSVEVLARMRAQPDWADRAARACSVIVREMAITESYRLPAAEQLRRWNIPTLLLVGETSPSHHHDTAQYLCACLPRAEMHVIPGQGHNAMTMAPGAMARAVLDFFG